ncbi:hpr [Symbiodinium natans]|uniref:Hpr protein n=1 Tax=Symbiodinium natans TaxID=878477 RepID=A0A812STI9_9DINO|nr:hpr [Symbiodinium natans]
MDIAPDVSPVPQAGSSMDDWCSAFHAHVTEVCKQQLRRRALLALALISEPLERQWNEVFLDIAWAAWVDVVRSAKRAYQLPKAQRMYEKVLDEAHEAMGVSRLSVWRSGCAFSSSFSEEALALLLRRAARSERGLLQFLALKSAMFSRMLRSSLSSSHALRSSLRLSRGFAAKPRCVMLNAARLDFDGRMDWKKVTEVAELTSHDISATEEIVPRAQGMDIVMNKEFPIPGDIIRALPPSVKLIAEAGTGYNNIDLDACREKGIAICNVPEYTTEAMGDYAITLVMALSCSLAAQMKALAKGDRRYMQQCHLGHLDHFEIRGKTYGIIGGLGYIASNISKKALNLGMRVIVSDMPSTPLGMRDTGVEVVTFDDLLKQSDFISPMVPLNKHTKGLLNAECFDKMKPSAYVINTARGPIVDQEAIIDALRKKKIAGAALDVFGEGSAPPPPLPENSPLYDVFDEFENVILTPHIGWQRVEARQRVVDGCGDNIAKFTRGEAMNIDMDVDLLMSILPRGPNGQVSLQGLVSWIFSPSSEKEAATSLQEWQDEWKVLRQQKHEHLARCRALLVLSLIAEPFKHCWREVFLDLAWWAWSSIVLEARRLKSLPERQAEFEREAERLSADPGNRVALEDIATAATQNLNLRDQPAQENAQRQGADALDIPPGFDRDRLVEVLKMKEQANEKYRTGDYFSAKCLYSGSLEMLERCCLHLTKSDEVWEGIKNNMALCDLKRREWARAVETTTEILQRNSKNTKALYRRGVARIGQGKLREAREDLEAVVELEPENADARQKLAEILRQLKANRTAEKDQADKMRGFLRGERLDDTVPITEDGGVRKLHSNENAPLFASWIKRGWLEEKSGVAGVVTAHVVMKTQAGKELLNTRKPPGSLSADPGPQLATQPKAAERPAEPARWVMDDSSKAVFQAWNSAGKTLQLFELGKFEVARSSMGPSVEAAIRSCLDKWLPDTPEQRELYKNMEELKPTALRRQAIQILGLPEEFCLEEEKEPNSTLMMEMELLESSEFTDLDGDGRRLLHVAKEGKRSASSPVVSELSTVQAHFRVAKLLMNYALKDTRLGLANGPNGLVLRADRMKEPMEFIVGEEAAAAEGDFVPPCIGQCLKLPPTGVTEGMQFEVILREGVPIRDMEKDIHSAYSDGKYTGLPDTSGPVSIRIEVEKVTLACQGPSDGTWQGLESILQERRRAEALQSMDEGRHKSLALKRWRRILVWFEEILTCRQWKTQEGKAGDSMYDLQWDDDGAEKQFPFQPKKRLEEKLPSMLDVEEVLLKQLKADELSEFARAHAATASLLSGELSRKHAQCAVQACGISRVPADVEVRGRSTLAWRLSEEGKSAEALSVLKEAQALDPSSTDLKDQIAVITQKDNETKSVSTLEALKSLKQDLTDSFEANDTAGLKLLLQELDSLPLTWEVASETKIGKEVGMCAKHADAGVAEPAKSIIARLHKLAKAERPLWVR